MSVQFKLPAILANKGIDEARYNVLKSALYPQASDAGIGVVLDICKSRGLDPMKKPYHIVKYGGKEQFVPSVDLLRTLAHRTGRYAGQDEVTFGPDETRKFRLLQSDYQTGQVTKDEKFDLTFPTWAKVTVYRVVGGQRCGFTAVVYWTEAYAKANKNGDAPNDMWRTRTRGQLEKCAEAAALRKAFPEETGEEQTIEEIVGHDDEVPLAQETVEKVPENGQDRVSKILDAEIVEEEADPEMEMAIENMRSHLRTQLEIKNVTYSNVGELDAEIDAYKSTGTMAAYQKLFPDKYELLLAKIANKRARLENQVSDEIPL